MDELNDFEGSPFELFELWFGAAKELKIEKPEAFCLASVDKLGMPKARMVLHKGFMDQCFTFYTNYESAKGIELESNPKVSALFYWLKDDMDHQVRVEGSVEKMTPEESAVYFHSRPRGSQVGAWASPQSEEIPSRAFLDEKVQEVQKNFPEGELPLPEFWGGYKIRATAFDFMILRQDRLHDRFRYEFKNGEWSRKRLAP